ncbi:MAG: hypothetical protein ED859_00925 [Desulfuromonadales bacterium]|nr:MAG: hypothetical protein ED859_00925 [Desulfuromonadales bacterium]
MRHTMALHSSISFPLLEDPSMPLLLSGFAMEDVLFVLFAGLGVVGVLCQFVPGGLLFISMIRSMLGYTRPQSDRLADSETGP